jgi:hypothetical protein
MAKAKTGNLIGSWAFLVGLILALIFGAFGAITQGVLIVLVIIGLVVGLLNVADKEVTPFLLSGVVLIIVASLGKDQMSTVSIFGSMLEALLAMFVPATIIVAIKNVFSLARN